MPIAVECPSCHKKDQLPDTAAGKNVRCQCGNSFKVAGSRVAQTQGDPALELAPSAAPTPQPTPDAAALQAMRESVFKARVCPVCNAAWPEGGSRCGQCNWDMMTGKHVAADAVRQQKAAAPARELVPVADHAEGGTPQLWNPNVAANWSLVFSPVFGAVLHAANWRALGKPEKASVNMVWAWVTAGFALVNLLRLFLPENGTVLAASGRSAAIQVNGIMSLIGLGLLLGWCFTQDNPQIKYVKETLPAGYAKRSWGTALGIGVVWVTAVFATVNLLLFLPELDTGLNGSMSLIGLGLLLGWYFTQGSPQIKYVKETLPAGYVKRSWWTPLGIGVAGVIGYVAAAFGLVVMVIGSGKSKAFNAYIVQVEPLLAEQDGMIRRFDAFEKNASEKTPSKEDWETVAAEMARQADVSLLAFRRIRPDDTEVAKLHSILVARAQNWQTAMTVFLRYSHPHFKINPPFAVQQPHDEATMRMVMAGCKMFGDCLPEFKVARDAFCRKYGIAFQKK